MPQKGNSPLSAKPKSLSTSLQSMRNLVGGVFVALLTCYFIWFGLVQGFPVSNASSTWGSFGDFVGGVLNPLIAFCAFYLLSKSLILQQAELQETKEALVASKDAQERLANSTDSQMKFNLISHRLSALEEKLGAERRKLEFGVQHMSKNMENNRVIGLDGKAITTLDFVTTANADIEEIEKLRETLFLQLEEVSHA